MFTILPRTGPSFFFISGIAYLHIKTILETLTPKPCAHSSMSTSYSCSECPTNPDIVNKDVNPPKCSSCQVDDASAVLCTGNICGAGTGVTFAARFDHLHRFLGPFSVLIRAYH